MGFKAEELRVQSLGFVFSRAWDSPFDKGTLLGTPNREPQEYSKNIMEYSYYIPTIFLGFPIWGSQ